MFLYIVFRFERKRERQTETDRQTERQTERETERLEYLKCPPPHFHYRCPRWGVRQSSRVLRRRRHFPTSGGRKTGFRFPSPTSSPMEISSSENSPWRMLESTPAKPAIPRYHHEKVVLLLQITVCINHEHVHCYHCIKVNLRIVMCYFVVILSRVFANTWDCMTVWTSFRLRFKWNCSINV